MKYCGRNLRPEVSWSQKGLWCIAKKRMLEGRGVVPQEDGNQLREEKAMHEENFLSSWLWEDVEGEKVEMGKLKEESG